MKRERESELGWVGKSVRLSTSGPRRVAQRAKKMFMKIILTKRS